MGVIKGKNEGAAKRRSSKKQKRRNTQRVNGDKEGKTRKTREERGKRMKKKKGKIESFNNARLGNCRDFYINRRDERSQEAAHTDQSTPTAWPS